MPKSVLIVDDHAGFRRNARMLLELEGFHVIGEADCGAAAIAAARELAPELVLLDIELGDLDGFTIAGQLAALDDRPAVVFVSNRDGVDFERKIHSAGALGFIAKHELSGAALAELLS